MFTIWVVFHVLISIALMLVVLMQSAKGDGLAGTAFSGGLSGAVFGGRGAASFLSRATTVLAIVFMVNCGVLAFMSAKTRTTTDVQQTGESVVTRKMAEEQERMLQQQQAAQEATRQDSIARATVQDQPVDLLPPQPDSN
ncbi:MAG TPA: preprotein translocase subunit SecG [Acidobacteriota bacterium]|nr:preprotein translocase subunit SecG [Acidobacteriota bacterium]